MKDVIRWMLTKGDEGPLSPPGLIANLIDSAIDPPTIFQHLSNININTTN